MKAKENGPYPVGLAIEAVFFPFRFLTEGDAVVVGVAGVDSGVGSETFCLLVLRVEESGSKSDCCLGELFSVGDGFLFRDDVGLEFCGYWFTFVSATAPAFALMD